MKADPWQTVFVNYLCIVCYKYKFVHLGLKHKPH